MRETIVKKSPDVIVRGSGYIAIGTSLVVLIAGLFLVDSAADDLKASMLVTEGAVVAIDETVALVENATQTLQEGVEAASGAVAGVSATAELSADGILDLADFLEQDLSEDLQSLRSAMPAAIQAATAIDRTLRALSLLGVDYDPAQPFDDSLRTFDQALASMPEDIRAQSDTLRNLAPATSALSRDSERLVAALDMVGSDLAEMERVSLSYAETLSDARTTIEETSASLDNNVWLVRLVLVAMAVTGIAVGVGLVSGSTAFRDVVIVEAPGSSEASDPALTW